MKRLLLVAALILTYGALLGADERMRILVLFSYHPGFPSYVHQSEGLESVFTADDYHLDYEFLDSKRFPDGKILEANKELILQKIILDGQNESYDCILTADDNALRFVLENRERIGEALPLFFFGVNNRDLASSASNQPLVSGVVEDISLEKNLDLIRSLYPEKAITVVSDGTSSGQGDLLFLKKILKSRNDGGKFVVLDLSEHSWDAAGEYLKRGGDSPVLLLSAYVDARGDTKSFEQGMEYILSAAKGPLFHLWSHGVGDGMVGGVLVSQYQQARQASLMAVEQLLTGRVAPLMSESPNEPVFDSAVLSEWGIDPALLPEESLFLNNDETLRDKLGTIFLPLSMVFVILLTLLLIMAFMLMRMLNAVEASRADRKKLRTYIEMTPAGMLIVDRNGIVIEANPAADHIFDIMPEEGKRLAGQSLLTLFPGYRAERLFLSGDYGGKADRGQLKYKSPRGSNKVLSAEAVSLDDGNYLISFVDITEIRKFEKHKDLQRKELQAIVDLIPVMIYIKDAEGNFQMINKAAAGNMGFKVNEVLGKNHRDLHLAPEDWERMLKTDRIVLETKKPYYVGEEHFTMNDGREVDIETYKMPFRSIETGEDAVLGVTTDITEKKKYGRELVKSESLRSLGSLAGGIAHEFNNQLMGMQGYLELISREAVPEEKRSFYDGVHKAISRSSELIRNLLSFSRKTPQLIKEEDLNRIIDEVLSLFSVSAGRGVVVRKKFSEKSSILRCDAGVLQNAFLNILLNSSEAMGGKGTVRVRTTRIVLGIGDAQALEMSEGEYFMVSFADEGPGIPPEVRKRMFEPFYTTKKDRSGMGLAAVFGAVKSHGGGIEVLGETGEGTEIRLYLPVGRRA